MEIMWSLSKVIALEKEEIAKMQSKEMLVARLAAVRHEWKLKGILEKSKRVFGSDKYFPLVLKDLRQLGIVKKWIDDVLFAERDKNIKRYRAATYLGKYVRYS